MKTKLVIEVEIEFTPYSDEKFNLEEAENALLSEISSVIENKFNSTEYAETYLDGTHLHTTYSTNILNTKKGL